MAQESVLLRPVPRGGWPCGSCSAGAHLTHAARCALWQPHTSPLPGGRFQAARCCHPRGTARFSPPPRLDPSLTEHDLFIVACVITAFALFGLGAYKARFNEKYYLRSGVETLVLGGLCALIAFVVGRFVASFAGEDLR